MLGWNAGIGLPVLAACLALFYRLQPKVQQFQSSRVHLSSLFASVEDVQALLRRSDKPYLSRGTEPFQQLEKSIQFDQVGYRYSPESRHAVEQISFEIPRAKMLAVVGASGAGKSTLAHLLCRLSDPQEGRILVDGHPLTELDQWAWRERIAIAGQDADLADGTVAENIAYGRPAATRNEIMLAARHAEAADFIESLPNGYDTMLLSGGRSLSAGERQRIGLARALLRKPCLLILDEAVSSLDNAASTAVYNMIESLRGKVTIFIIAHRLETILRADEILVLSAGRIVERGDAEALLGAGGVFAGLYTLERHLGESPSGADMYRQQIP